jgi:hypothetical protein
MEESNAWRYPVDLIAILEQSFADLPAAVEAGSQANAAGSSRWMGRRGLADVLLADNAQSAADALLESLRAGCPADELASAVAYAAALRIARFHTSNEFGDWDTALHTFTFANAIHQGLRRAPSVELLRGVFDATMSIYLDRFLNIPAARLPQLNGNGANPPDLQTLSQLLDRQQQVNQAADEVARYLHHGGESHALLARIGRLLLREDRDFHTIQMVEAAVRQHSLVEDPTERSHLLIAAIRYLAAHSPTVRAQGQTYTIAQRLHHGERLFEGD